MTPPMDGDTYPDVDHQAPMFDLGVLFVHGIGRQGTGETLVHLVTHCCGGSTSGSPSGLARRRWRALRPPPARNSVTSRTKSANR